LRSTRRDQPSWARVWAVNVNRLHRLFTEMIGGGAAGDLPHGHGEATGRSRAAPTARRTPSSTGRRPAAHPPHIHI
jgi:hypothetical protein